MVICTDLFDYSKVDSGRFELAIERTAIYLMKIANAKCYQNSIRHIEQFSDMLFPDGLHSLKIERILKRRRLTQFIRERPVIQGRSSEIR